MMFPSTILFGTGSGDPGGSAYGRGGRKKRPTKKAAKMKAKPKK